VGLSALTAWGLSRFNELRSTIDLPPITDPGFEDAVIDAQESLTAQAIAETFTAAAFVLGAGVLATLAMRRRATRADHEFDPPDADRPPPADASDLTETLEGAPT
jgi:MFS transporter, DHA2 family, triacylglyceride efflux pump